MKSAQILFLALSISIVFTACKKDDNADTEKPKIQVLLPTDTHVETKRDSIVTFSARITDNVGLKQYKIEIHDASDGHTHGGRSNGTNADSNWRYDEIKDISGTSYETGIKTFRVPTNAKLAEYHLILKATDNTGNEAKEAEIELHVQ
jgi:hypothetical protein